MFEEAYIFDFLSRLYVDWGLTLTPELIFLTRYRISMLTRGSRLMRLMFLTFYRDCMLTGG